MKAALLITIVLFDSCKGCIDYKVERRIKHVEMIRESDSLEKKLRRMEDSVVIERSKGIDSIIDNP